MNEAANVAEVYDASVMGSSQIRKTGQRGEIGRDRKKSEPEKRRVKAIGGGKTAPAKSYKDRKDIGTQRQASTRTQQPTRERGSADVKQSYADKVKAERKKAAQARIAARQSGGEVKKTTTSSKDTEKQASKLLTKKTTKSVSPKYDPKAGKPQKSYTRSERQKLMRSGERELERRVRDAEGEKQGKNPKDVKLKNFNRTWATNK